jgi:murein DD-endopeptidase MepM/ murein hydrolase activator NlpD
MPQTRNKKQLKRKISPPIVAGKSTSPFGMRGGSMHMGEDIIPTTTDSNVLAVYEGIIVEVVTGCIEGNMQCGGGYGNYVTIDHQNGYFTRYAHLYSLLPTLQKGQKVRKGQKLGIMGNTGHSFGAHLHFEVLTANTFYSLNPTAFLDPAPYLRGEKLFPKQRKKGMWGWLIGAVAVGFLMVVFFLIKYFQKPAVIPAEAPPTVDDMGDVDV